MKDFKVWCPRCNKTVDRVDGEYARHHGASGVLCTMSRREISKARPMSAAVKSNAGVHINWPNTNGT